jgi:dephospho-CoA kinase
VKIIGLTGGLGMGKSTAAAVFRRAGVPVFDADAAVHKQQARGGRAVARIAREFPDAVLNGEVNRDALRRQIIKDRAALRRLEQILHPLVREEERAFVHRMRRLGETMVVLDIPLLLETGADARVDFVVVVSAPVQIQEYRIRLRRRMTRDEVRALVARQMPDRDKRRRADAVVRTGLSRYHGYREICRLIRSLQNGTRYPIRHGNYRIRTPSRTPRYRDRRVGVD